mgnify:CR=1 FL=1
MASQPNPSLSEYIELGRQTPLDTVQPKLSMHISKILMNHSISSNNSYSKILQKRTKANQAKNSNLTILRIHNSIERRKLELKAKLQNVTNITSIEKETNILQKLYHKKTAGFNNRTNSPQQKDKYHKVASEVDHKKNLSVNPQNPNFENFICDCPQKVLALTTKAVRSSEWPRLDLNSVIEKTQVTTFNTMPTVNSLNVQ